MAVEPVPDRAAAVVTTDDQRLLVVADYHAGIEAVLRSEGVEIQSRATERRRQLLALLAETEPDRLVVLGDLKHTIGDPWDAERDELSALLDAVDVPITLVKGNHDAGIEALLDALGGPVTTTGSGGLRIGDVGFAHGHTWPDPEVLSAETLCIGHEHPTVRLTDDVGGTRFERAWLRGRVDPDAFRAEYGDSELGVARIVVFPAFNDLSGGTRINAQRQEFLSPFLPAALSGGEAYLLDGTRLGGYATL